MAHFLISSVIIACLASFLISLAYKWGWVEYAQVHGDDLTSRLAHCNLCMSFWTCMVISLVASCITGDAWYLLCPFVSTTISKSLLQ